MKKEKSILIVEKSTFQLLNKGVENRSDGKRYIVLEGIFGVLNEINRNRRIYTADQYLPHVNSLQEKIGASKLLGELNHPTNRFDVDLEKVSHVIEKLYYDDSTNQIKGTIRLLNTPTGQIAQRLVEDGIPLHISSRAAGSVNPDGTVVMKQLFTYDLVAEPGFEKAELTRVNEKYGYDDLSNISLYEIEEDKLDENNMNQKIEQKDNIYNKKDQMDYVRMEDFNRYTEYLKGKISELNEKLSNYSSNIEVSETNFNNKKYNEINEKYKVIEEKYNTLVGFVNYLSEHLNKSIAHGDHVVENVLEMKKYIDYLATNLDSNIGYSKYIVENVDNLISHNNHIVGMVNKNIDFSNYLRENLNSVLEELENNRLYSEYVANGADKGIQYIEYVAEKLDEAIQYSEHVGEVTNKTANYANYLRETLNKSINHTDYIAESINNGGTLRNTTVNENYQESIINRLDNIINEARQEKANVKDDKLHFLKFLDADRTKIFSAMNEENKIKVIKAFDNGAYYSAQDAAAIFEGALKTDVPQFIKNMKEHHKEIWNSLNENKRKLILEQSENYVLESQDQIDYFWDTMDLREEKVNLESIKEKDEKDKLNESTEFPNDDYMKRFEAQMLERMG